MMTNKKKIEALQVAQAHQQAQIYGMEKSILSLCVACGITAISAARANKKARKLEAAMMEAEVSSKTAAQEKKEKKVKTPEAPKAPEAAQPTQDETEVEAEE